MFDAVYQGNPLVNALAVGVLRHEDLKLANAPGAGNKVVLFGARTGGDGIGGASILASDTFADGGPTKRPAVQVGDPFAEKVLIECCLELFRGELVEAIQDLGAAGISCATSELAANGDSGMRVDLEKVLLRDPTLTPEEILMSESQERMMAIVRPEKLDAFLAVVDKWDVETSVLGEVTDNGRLRSSGTASRSSTSTRAPSPSTARSTSARSPTRPGSTRCRTTRPQRSPRPTTPTRCARSSCSCVGPEPRRHVVGHEPVRLLRHGQHRALLPRRRRHDPRRRALRPRLRDRDRLQRPLLPARPVRGRQARPRRGVPQRRRHRRGARRRVTDCLNFGRPENPEVMWQFSEAVEGLADGCLELGIPVTGGNVSFYNQTGDQPIFPTPVVGVLGIIDDVARRIPSGWQDDGREHLPARRHARPSSTARRGPAPCTATSAAARPRSTSRTRSASPSCCTRHPSRVARSSAHDLADGGLAQALAEAVMRFGVGARVWLTEIMERDGVDAATALFSESTGRVIVTVPREDDVKFRGLCEGRGYPVLRIGVTDAASGAARGAGPVHRRRRRAARDQPRAARRRVRRRSSGTSTLSDEARSLTQLDGADVA